MITADQRPLVWIDLETTGIDPAECRILEVACIVTVPTSRVTLEEVDRFTAVTCEARRVALADLRPVVQKMHGPPPDGNGLWQESLDSERTLTSVALDLQSFLERTVARGAAQLAGSTISFDRAFLKAWMPSVESHLHYRNLDVSSLNEVARRWDVVTHEQRPAPEAPAHRATDDVEASIEVLRHYIERWIGDEDGY